MQFGKNSIKSGIDAVPSWGKLVFLLALLGLGLAACSGKTPAVVPSQINPAEPAATTPAPQAIVPSVTVSLTVEAPAPEPQEPSDTPFPDQPPTATITAWPNDTATPGPSPTRTRTPTRTRIPTRTRAPTLTPTITLTPTVTFTPTPPAPDIDIVRPGLMSKVVSPIQMEMNFVTGAEGIVTVELIGEDGRVISRQVLTYQRANRSLWAAPEIPFEIDGAAETARLQVLTRDEQGRMIDLASVDVILLSAGRNEINPPAITQASYLVRSPEWGDTVRGGMLVIDALARPVNDSPLLIELVDENGTVVTVKQVVVPPPAGPLSHTPFTVQIPYKVGAEVPVRLVIRQEGSRIPGTVALYSQPLVLAP
jgi:hypothetical protein